MTRSMTLHAILIGAKAREPLHYVESVRAVEGRGLEGDRYFYGQGTFNKPQLSQDVREISLLPYESLAECNRRLKSDLDFPDLRRNLVITHFDVSLLEEKVFTIGTAKFRIVRTCPPCRYLSRLLDKDMMAGLKYIGGYRAVVVQSGDIRVGDEITF
ncbi:MAG TPA: MOSC domain-containing protein [Sulfurovum sp.]|uniref:MOSC domain-containing protein n=1 Tax=Sulfurovum sp. TaxID=1969726 RepID=UPI002F93BC6D